MYQVQSDSWKILLEGSSQNDCRFDFRGMKKLPYPCFSNSIGGKKLWPRGTKRFSRSSFLGRRSKLAMALSTRRVIRAVNEMTDADSMQEDCSNNSVKMKKRDIMAAARILRFYQRSNYGARVAGQNPASPGSGSMWPAMRGGRGEEKIPTRFSKRIAKRGKNWGKKTNDFEDYLARFIQLDGMLEIEGGVGTNGYRPKKRKASSKAAPATASPQSKRKKTATRSVVERKRPKQGKAGDVRKRKEDAADECVDSGYQVAPRKSAPDPKRRRT